MLCAVLLAFKKWTPRANWGKFSPNMGLRSDLKQDSVPVFLCVLRFFLTHLLALLCLTQHVRPARQGLDFSLQQVYLLEGVSLSDDPLSFISDQWNGCKSFSTLQYFLRMENNKGLLILWKTHFISYKFFTIKVNCDLVFEAFIMKQPNEEMLGFHQQSLNTTPETAESEHDDTVK